MTPTRNDGFMIDDAEYGYNKTEPLRAAFAKSVSAISNLHVLTINRTFGSVIPDDLVACVSLRVNDTDRADGQSECPFSNRKAMDAYAKIRGDAEAALSRARNGVAEFADDAEDFTASATEAVSTFFQFFNGVQALVDNGVVGLDDDSDVPGWFSMLSDPGLFLIGVPSCTLSIALCCAQALSSSLLCIPNAYNVIATATLAHPR